MEYRTELSLEENLNFWLNTISKAIKGQNKVKLPLFINSEIEKLNSIDIMEDEKFLIIQERCIDKFTLETFKKEKTRSKWTKIQPYILGFLISLTNLNTAEAITYILQYIIEPPSSFKITEFSEATKLSNLTIIILFSIFILIGAIWTFRKQLQNSSISKLLNFPFLLIVSIITHFSQKFLIPKVLTPITRSDVDYVYLSYVNYNLSIIEIFLILIIVIIALSSYIIVRKGNSLKIAK